MPQNPINSATTESLITAALATLPSSHLSHLTHSISTVFHRERLRLSSLLSSPTLFSLTLRHLQSLTLQEKSLLIARHLLSNLTLLKHFMHNTTSNSPTPPHSIACMKLRDVDAVLLLLLLCELHKHDRGVLDAPPSKWREILSAYMSDSLLKLSSLGGSCCSSNEVLIHYIESVARCWNLVSVIGCRGEGKERRDTAAAPAAVVALPSVEVSGGECVICKEEMRLGREVCELPCRHLFHWMCILKWLKKRDTCPCCRRRLPTDDVHREIERLLDDLAEIGGGGGDNRLYQECV